MAKIHPLSDLPKMKSTNGDEVIVTFHNATGSDLNAYWIDYQGSLINYGPVPAGKDFGQHTYLTHPFVFFGAGGFTQIYVMDQNETIRLT